MGVDTWPGEEKGLEAGQTAFSPHAEKRLVTRSVGVGGGGGCAASGPLWLLQPRPPGWVAGGGWRVEKGPGGSLLPALGRRFPGAHRLRAAALALGEDGAPSRFSRWMENRGSSSLVPRSCQPRVHPPPLCLRGSHRPPGKGVRAARPLPRPDPTAAALGFLPLGAPPGSPEVVAPCPGVGDTSPFGCPRCCTEHGLSPACSGPGRRVVPDFPGLCGSRDVVCTRNGVAWQAAGVPDGSGRAQGSSAHWPRHCCRKAARHPGSRSAFLSGSLESRLRGGRPTDAGGPQGRPGP